MRAPRWPCWAAGRRPGRPERRRLDLARPGRILSDRTFVRERGRVGELSRPTLEVVDLTVRFGGILALDQVSLRIDAGEVVGIIGPNGAGKTRLFKAVCGFVRPDSGRIDYRGEPLLGTAPHRLARLGIARTLQGLGLWPGLTVQENVVAGSRVRPALLSSLLALPSSDRIEAELASKAREILDRLGIGGHPEAYPRTPAYCVPTSGIIAPARMT